MIFVWLLIIFLGFFLPLLICVFAVFSVLGDFMGAPYVPTQTKMVEEILEKARLKRGQTFLELGSGDGRVTRMAVRKFGVVGVGVEMHPFLVWYANVVSKLQHVKNIHFKRGNFFKEDFSKADVIFLFLLPKTLVNLRQKLLNQSKKGTLIISH